LLLGSDAAGAEWDDCIVSIQTAARQIDDLAFPTTSGRSLDVTATGGAGIDWGNVENQTTTVGLSGTTVKTATDVETDTSNIQTRLPAALSGDGFIKADLKSIDDETTDGNNATLFLKQLHISNATGDAVNISALGGNAIKAQSFDNDGVQFLGGTGAAGIYLFGDLYGLETEGGDHGIVAWGDNDNAVEFESFAANGDALNLVATGTGKSIRAEKDIELSDGTLNLTAIEDTVWDASIASHLDAGTTGEKLNDAGAAGNPWSEALPGAYASGTAGFIVGTNLDATVSSRLEPTTAGRKLDVTATGEAGIDWGNIGAPTTTQNLSGTTIKAVTDPVTAGTVSDKTGYSLSSAAIQAIWDALTSALTAVGSIGKLLVDNINATISSRASQTSLDTLDDYVDTEVAAILAAVDTEIAAILVDTTAIKAKTSQLTFTNPGEVDANIQAVNDTELQGDGSGTPWGPV
jgi:hypothetical protein